MGSLQSSLSTDQVMAGTAVAAVVAVALYNAKSPAASSAQSTEGSMKKPRKRKTKGVKGDDDGTPPSLAASAALFGDDPKSSVISEAGALSKSIQKLDSLQVPKASKKKRKAAKEAATTSASSTGAKSEDDDEGDVSENTPKPQSQPAAMTSSASSGKSGKKGKLSESTTSFTSTPAMDASWTRVDSRSKGKAKRDTASSEAGTSAAEASSDAGVMTSATGDEEGETGEEPQTLAEKLLPRPPKTEVDDMLPAGPGLARVMRVTSNQPVQETPSGISWRDYEEAEEMQQSTDADAEDDEGWGIVQGRKRTPRPETTPSSSVSNSRVLPSTISDAEASKRQRQREAKREASKAAKAEGEEDRLATLARYKREQEKARMDAQAKKAGAGGKSKLSGGMTASVQNGALVWE